MKRALVLGGNGFLGAHMVARLSNEGYGVRAVGRHRPILEQTGWRSPVAGADEFNIWDLRHPPIPKNFFENIDEVYQFASESGGLGYIENPTNSVDILTSSIQINLNVLECCRLAGVQRIFFASSACVYPEKILYYYNAPYPFPQANVAPTEASAYPANPPNPFGWEKLFAERLYETYAKHFNIAVSIGRFGNTYGPGMPWQDPRAKVIGALIRKVVEATEAVDIWGDGMQKRSFTYVDDAIEGARRMMLAAQPGPLNIANAATVTINQLTDQLIAMSGKRLMKNYISGPTGMRERGSDNSLIRMKLDWEPSIPLAEGLIPTYRWVEAQMGLDILSTKAHTGSG